LSFSLVLPTTTTKLIRFFLFFPTLTPSHRRAKSHIERITGSIVPIVTSIHTMLSAPWANILMMNRNTAAIANKHLLLLFLLLLISTFYRAKLEKSIGIFVLL
jgi:hypothetical protein